MPKSGSRNASKRKGEKRVAAARKAGTEGVSKRSRRTKSRRARIRRRVSAEAAAARKLEPATTSKVAAPISRPLDAAGRPATFASAAALRCTCATCNGRPDPDGAYECRAADGDDGFCPDCTREYGSRHLPMNARGEAIEPECRCEECLAREERGDGLYGPWWPLCTDENDEPCKRCMKVGPEGTEDQHVCLCKACGGACAGPTGAPCGDCVFLDGTHVAHEMPCR